MRIHEDKWFEVWFSDGEDVIPYYLLIVTPDLNKLGNVIVLDPKSNEIIRKGHNYEDTKLWLLEDEYSLVEGRVFPDDGWQEIV